MYQFVVDVAAGSELEPKALTLAWHPSFIQCIRDYDALYMIIKTGHMECGQGMHDLYVLCIPCTYVIHASPPKRLTPFLFVCSTLLGKARTGQEDQDRVVHVAVECSSRRWVFGEVCVGALQCRGVCGLY